MYYAFVIPNRETSIQPYIYSLVVILFFWFYVNTLNMRSSFPSLHYPQVPTVITPVVTLNYWRLQIPLSYLSFNDFNSFISNNNPKILILHYVRQYCCMWGLVLLTLYTFLIVTCLKIHMVCVYEISIFSLFYYHISSLLLLSGRWKFYMFAMWYGCTCWW